ncbi:hypothetical protein CsSME_00004758 [Camellia sinensis var. sinensis]
MLDMAQVLRVALPMVVAVKSLPPLPNVVTAQDLQPCNHNGFKISLRQKPVTIGIAGSLIQSLCNLFATAG